MTKLVVIQDAIPSDQFQHGGQALNQIILLLTGSPLDSEENIRINTTFKFYSGKLAIYDDDPARSHYMIFKLQNIASGANKSITYRVPTVDDDFAVTEQQNQTLSNKVLGTNTQVSASMDFNSNSILEAVINGSLNTITNIQDSSLSSNVPLKNQANVFTNTQKIQYGATTALTLYRNDNTIGNGTGLAFTMNNATPTEITLGQIFVVNNDTAVGSEDSTLAFYTRSNGILADRFLIDNLNRIRVGVSGSGVYIDPTGISGGSKVFTYPNLSGEVQTINATQTPINKTLDVRTNTILRMARIGRYHCASESGIDAEGVLLGLVGLGDQGTTTLNTAGKYHIWSTKAVIDDCAGVVKLNGFVTQRYVNPLVRFGFIFVASSTRRVFKGWTAQRLLTVSSNTEPLSSTESGFVFGYGIGDLNWQIWHNDGLGTCVKFNTGLALPAVATNLILEISNSGGTFTWALYGVDGNTQARSTLQGTGTINTRVPTSFTNLFLQDLVATSTASITAANIHYIEVFT